MAARKGRPKGQAVLEYVLLLFITVLIMVGAIYKFSGAFKVWADKYFVGENSVLFCLIEQGILPGQEGGFCEAKAELKLSNGKDLANSGSPIPVGDTSQSSSGQGASARIEAEAQAKAEASSSAQGRKSRGAEPQGAGGAGGAAGGGAPGGGRFGGRGGSGGGPNSGGLNDKEKSKFSSTENLSAAEAEKLRSQYGIDEEGYAIPLSRAERETLEATKKTKKTVANEADFKTKAQLINERNTKRELAEAAEPGWSIGKILKFLIIFGLLGMIIFFVGSQLSAVSKGKKRS